GLALSTSPGAAASDIAVGDIGKNGTLDVVVASCNGHSLTLYEASTPGFIFNNVVPFTFFSCPRAALLVDLDNDGFLDIVVADSTGGNGGVVVPLLYFQNANGFVQQTPIAVP